MSHIKRTDALKFYSLVPSCLFVHNVGQDGAHMGQMPALSNVSLLNSGLQVSTADCLFIEF